MGSDARDLASGSLKWSACKAFGKTQICFVAAIVVLMIIPTSAQTNNCCGVDRLCATDEEWINGYYAFQNNQCAAPSQQQQQQPATSPSQPQPVASEAVDNCCFVNRQCATDDEWINGYNAYQNNQCGAPAQQRQWSSSSTQTGTSEDGNNCCFFGWQCTSDAEWKNGYWAYQANSQCAPPSEQQRQRQQHRQNGNQQPSSSSDDGALPVKRTFDPYTRTTTFEYEDGSTLIARPPTNEEFCEAVKQLDLPLPPRCE